MKTNTTTYTINNTGKGESMALIIGRKGWYQIQWHGVQRPATVPQSSEFTTLRATMKTLANQAKLIGVKLTKV